MKKTIKAWAVFNNYKRILWGTIQSTKKEALGRFEVAYSGHMGQGFKNYDYHVRRITIVVEACHDGKEE